MKRDPAVEGITGEIRRGQPGERVGEPKVFEQSERVRLR
jgi:hypothetical protein